MRKIFSLFVSIIVVCFNSSAGASVEAPFEIDGAQTISVDAAKNLYEDGAVFIDVREKDAWSNGHIQGSINLDLAEDEFVVLYVSETLDRSTPIVFYSDSPLTSRGAVASYFAASWGYSNVYFFRDGYYAWIASDFPSELKLASNPHREDNAQENLAGNAASAVF